MKQLAIVFSVLFLLGATVASAQQVDVFKLTDLGFPGTLDGNKGGPWVTWLTEDEGGDSSVRAGLGLKVNNNTTILLSPGADQSFESSDDGVIHCFKIGTTGQNCEFIATGALLTRRPVLVNSKAVVLTGAGPNESECEEFGSTADDQLIVLRNLGAAGAQLDTVDDLCFGTPGADPIRINNNTVITAQPGADRRFPDSSCPTGLANDDTVVVVEGLNKANSLTVTTLNVGDELGVHLTGAPASLPVRINNDAAVISSPGPDSQFADGTDGCTDSDDGFVVITGLAKTGAATLEDFITIGNLMAGHQGRPIAVGNSAVVIGTGSDQTQPEREDFASVNCCWVFTPSTPANDELHVVENVATDPVITTFDGFGFMRRPIMLNKTTAVAFDEDYENATREDEVALAIHVVKNIGKDPTLKNVPVPTGDGFWTAAWGRKEVGLVMNAKQLIFSVAGPFQPILFTPNGRNIFGPAGGSSDEWAATRMTRLSNTVAAYTAAMEGNIGVLKIVKNGLQDTRVINSGQGNDSGPAADISVHQPSSQPVALSSGKFVVAFGGSTGFTKASESDETGGPDRFGFDDGFYLIDHAGTRPEFEWIEVGNLCGAPGCQPLALGTGFKPIVVFAGPGDNGEFDNNGDQADNDDELIVVTDL